MDAETKAFYADWNEDFEASLQLWNPVIEFCNEHALLKPVARWIETNQAQARGFVKQKEESKFFDNNHVAHAFTVLVLEMHPPVQIYDLVNKYYRPEQGILGHALVEATYRFYLNKTATIHEVK